jgi:hypothetical protein
MPAYPYSTLFRTTLELQSEFVDKQTGLPLAGGVVYFWQDTNRNQPQPVYELTGSPPNYTMTALANPLQLTNGGTFSDGSTNDISVYYYPYDGGIPGGPLVPSNYYVQVFAQPSIPPYPPVGTPILTRENVPGVVGMGGTSNIGAQGNENAISNSQFSQVYFNPSFTETINYTSAGLTVKIGPGWYLKIAASGSGSLTLQQIPFPGISANETNPPYALQVNPGTNITSLILYQRFFGNSDIFTPPFSNPDIGYVSAGFALSPNPYGPTVSMFYAPSNAPAQPLTTAANTGSVWEYFSGNFQLNLGANTATPPAAYVDIQLVLSTTSSTRISSIQVVGIDSDTNDGTVISVPYNQQPINNQISGLFYDYKPGLDYKPIPSYLVGWDFPTNPAQFFGSTGAVAAQAVGANKSYYAWDQTIIFQSVNSGVTVSRGTANSLTLTAAQTGQFAIIQYLPATQAAQILDGPTSIHLAALTNNANGYTATVSLWVTSDATISSLASGTNNSLVATLDANGHPATLNGNWTEITRPIGQTGIFTVGASSTLNFNDYYINEFNVNGVFAGPTPSNVRYVAIVVGFSAITMSDSITIESIGLTEGTIATRPAPKAYNQVLNECEYYYEKSYQGPTAIGAATNLNSLAVQLGCTTPTSNGATVYSIENAFTIDYRNLKLTSYAAPTVTLYSTQTANKPGYLSLFFTTSTPAGPTFINDYAVTFFGTTYIGDKFASYLPTSFSASPTAAPTAYTPNAYFYTFHYTVDSRIGIVNL